MGRARNAARDILQKCVQTLNNFIINNTLKIRVLGLGNPKLGRFRYLKKIKYYSYKYS